MPSDMSPERSPLEDSAGHFDFISFVQGHSRAYGIFEDRFGRVRRSFMVELSGMWHDGVFVLDEQFFYADGGRDERRWEIAASPDGTLLARAADVIGSARGRATHDGLTLAYRMRLDINGRTVELDFADRFKLIGADRLLSRAIVSKWGIRLGEVTLVMERARSQQDQSAAQNVRQRRPSAA